MLRRRLTLRLCAERASPLGYVGRAKENCRAPASSWVFRLDKVTPSSRTPFGIGDSEDKSSRLAVSDGCPAVDPGTEGAAAGDLLKILELHLESDRAPTNAGLLLQ